MEIFWLVVGLLIGLLIAWFWFRRQDQMRRQEIKEELAVAGHSIKDELLMERGAHDTTRRLLSVSKAEKVLVLDEARSLEADLVSIRKELNKSNAQVAGAEARIRRQQAQITNLESQLQEANRTHLEAVAKLENAELARGQENERNQSGISDLQRPVRERDNKISRLQANLGLAQSMLGASIQTAEPNEERTGPTSNIPKNAAELIDDLTQIKGIGSVLQGKLVGLGITTFRQIADFTKADIERINAVLDFPGRIEREHWVDQAKEKLAIN